MFPMNIVSKQAQSIKSIYSRSNVDVKYVKYETTGANLSKNSLVVNAWGGNVPSPQRSGSWGTSHDISVFPCTEGAQRLGILCVLTLYIVQCSYLRFLNNVLYHCTAFTVTPPSAPHIPSLCNVRAINRVFWGVMCYVLRKDGKGEMCTFVCVVSIQDHLEMVRGQKLTHSDQDGAAVGSVLGLHVSGLKNINGWVESQTYPAAITHSHFDFKNPKPCYS